MSSASSSPSPAKYPDLTQSTSRVSEVSSSPFHPHCHYPLDPLVRSRNSIASQLSVSVCFGSSSSQHLKPYPDGPTRLSGCRSPCWALGRSLGAWYLALSILASSAATNSHLQHPPNLLTYRARLSLDSVFKLLKSENTPFSLNLFCP